MTLPAIPKIVIPKMTEHGGELVLLGLVVCVVGFVLIRVIDKGITGWDIAACFLTLQGVVNAIKDRWTARNQAQSNALLSTSQPAAAPTE